MLAGRGRNESKRRAAPAIAEETAAATGSEIFHCWPDDGARWGALRILSETLSESRVRWLLGSDFSRVTYNFRLGTSVAAGHVHYRYSLREKFQEDLWLQQIGAESVGADEKRSRTISHIAALHTEPMDPSEDDVAS
jgi:hypothetical protein